MAVGSLAWMDLEIDIDDEIRTQHPAYGKSSPVGRTGKANL
jgi:hypothetical protein